jgi:hypothetical protein
MMKSESNQSRDASSAIDKLLTAHNEIIKAWFAHWNDQERSRIDLAFDNSLKTLRNDRHSA